MLISMNKLRNIVHLEGTHMWRLLGGLGLILSCTSVNAAETAHQLDLTNTTLGWLALGVFVIAYAFVIMEENLHLRKSKPVIVAAGIIWILVGISYSIRGDIHTPETLVRHNILEFAELMLFLLAAMTYINTMEERNVFNALRGWLVNKGFSLRMIFWITGVLAFVISPVADNLTTALLMAAVVMAVGGDNKAFVGVACINIVVAANAGGAFSPFGDITTLMVWQKGIVAFDEFFALVIPSIVNWIVPAFIMSFTVPREKPAAVQEKVEVKKGAYVVIGLFLATIATAVSFHNFLHLPPMLGMMTGMGVLKLYGYYLKQSGELAGEPNAVALEVEGVPSKDTGSPFDIFNQLQRAEWDTLMFFYGGDGLSRPDL
jgi:Na+/H+ antiporter NhaD/arsenite permease-like protein